MFRNINIKICNLNVFMVLFCIIWHEEQISLCIFWPGTSEQPSMEHERRWLGGQLGAGSRRQSVKTVVEVWPLHCGASDVISDTYFMRRRSGCQKKPGLGKLLTNAVRRIQIYSDLKKRVWCVGAEIIEVASWITHLLGDCQSVVLNDLASKMLTRGV